MHITLNAQEEILSRLAVIVPSVRAYLVSTLLSDFLNWIDDERFEELVRLTLTDKKSAKKLIDALLLEYKGGGERRERKGGEDMRKKEKKERGHTSISVVEDFL